MQKMLLKIISIQEKIKIKICTDTWCDVKVFCGNLPAGQSYCSKPENMLKENSPFSLWLNSYCSEFQIRTVAIVVLPLSPSHSFYPPYSYIAAFLWVMDMLGRFVIGAVPAYLHFDYQASLSICETRDRTHTHTHSPDPAAFSL